MSAVHAIQVIKALSSVDLSGTAMLDDLAVDLQASGYVASFQNSRATGALHDCLHSLRHTYLECSRTGVYSPVDCSVLFTVFVQTHADWTAQCLACRTPRCTWALPR